MGHCGISFDSFTHTKVQVLFFVKCYLNDNNYNKKEKKGCTYMHLFMLHHLS